MRGFFKDSIIMLKMPFMVWHVVVEKEVPFLFRIMTLEMICAYLNIPMEKLFEEGNFDSDKMPLAMVWCGYLAACKELYQKPKYTIKEAEKWSEFMTKSTRDQLTKEVAVLLGSLYKASGEASSKKK